jgi:LacI family transcriptional regulator
MGHLLALGHRKIAHLAAAVDVETFQLRRAGYQDALREAGIPLVPTYEARAPFTIAGARQAARRLLTAPDPPTALLCDSDMLAVGIYKAASDLGRAIPRELSVVSFDDSLIASILEPELTTVAIPTASIGAQAFRLLLAVLEQQATPAATIVPLELIVRASTSSPLAKT